MGRFMSHRHLLLFLFLFGVFWALVPAAAHAEDAANPFPVPEAIRPQVAFWTRIYSEVTTRGGLLHDSRMMSVVYEKMKFGAKDSRRTRSRKIDARRDHYKRVLGTLAGGKRTGLTAEEQRVLALFPEGVSNQTLRAAQKRIRFQLGQANRFREGIIRSGRWEPHIAKVLAEHGVPYELSALPHVESSYNPEAYSHAGAAGLWQFTRSTGRIFMRVDHVVDERMDPYLASVAAAKLLLSNHRRTGTWPLAITSYNHGTAGMERAIRKLGTRRIDRVIAEYKSRTFGFASRNFYTSFVAAWDVSSNAPHFFGELTIDPAEDLEVVLTDHYYATSTLTRVFGVPTKTLRKYNGALRGPVWNGQKYVPKGYALRIPRRNKGPEPELVLAQIPASETILRQKADRTYRVRRGDTLSGIARRYGVKTRDLVALNGLRSQNRIRIGQKLRLPTHDGPTTVAMVRDHDRNARKRLERPADGIHRVRRGDTLSGIAETFGVSLQELIAVNGLRNKNRLVIGQKIKIPGEPIEARTTYVVQRGDSLERIARKHGVSLRSLQDANHIRNRNRIHPGQVLSIPGSGGAVARTELARTEPARHTVRRGETLAGIAAKYGVGVSALQAHNGLRNKNRIHPGQELEIPGRTQPKKKVQTAAQPPPAKPVPVAKPAVAKEPATPAEAVAVARVEATPPPEPATPPAAPGSGLVEPVVVAPDLTPEDLAITPADAATPAPSAPSATAGRTPSALPWAPDRYAVAADGSIVARPGETLGHYAEWLDVKTQRLRDLNHMAYKRPLTIGKRIRLDFSKTGREVFENRRLEHHRGLQAAFFDDFAVAGTEDHVLRRGDTLWKLSHRKYEVPVWLIQQYNPELDMNALRPGMRIAIPVVQPKKGNV